MGTCSSQKKLKSSPEVRTDNNNSKLHYQKIQDPPKQLPRLETEEQNSNQQRTKPQEANSANIEHEKRTEQIVYKKLSEVKNENKVQQAPPPIIELPKKSENEDPAKLHLEVNDLHIVEYKKSIKEQQINIIDYCSFKSQQLIQSGNKGFILKNQYQFMIKMKCLYSISKGVFRQTRRDPYVKKDQFILKVANDDEDIHARRLAGALNPEEVDGTYQGNSKFSFKQTNLKRMDLSDLYRIDFNNDANISIVPTLIEPLDEIINNPGIYHVDVFENHPNYKHIKRIQKDAQMNKFEVYIPPSKDKTLQDFAKTLNLKYCVSTSTFSNVLSQIYYLLCGFCGPDFDNIFEEFPNEPKKFMISQRKPTSALLHKINDNLYALDGDPGLFEEDLFELMNTGKIVERQLTQNQDEFINRYINLDPNMPPIEDFHRFMELNNEMCLRSQIDCRNKSNNPIVFEIKARGAAPIRYDYPNYLDYLDYEINKYKGLMQSFEREYYDLVRGAFLKWSVQLKIGRMDGAFVAYHNLTEYQGFEYIKASEIYKRIFGTEEFSDLVLLVGSRVACKLFDELIADINEDFTTLKIGVYCQSFTKKLILFVEILKDNQVYQKIPKATNLKDEYDYYKAFPLKNKVLKYEFLMRPEVNGIEYTFPTLFRKQDLISIKYRLRCLGDADFGDYMSFLHDCYKHEEINLEINYSGAWQRGL